MPRGKTKFDRCVKAVRKRGGAYDPEAVCGAMRARGELNPGRKRYWVLVDDGHLLGTFATKKAADQYASKVRMQSPGIGRISVKDSAHENPADAAAEAYKRFHGQDPSEYVTVTRKIHYHRYLWSIGDLVELKIKTEDGSAIVTLNEFNGTILAANEQAFAELVEEGRAHLTQLFIEGGHQRVNLHDFGIDPKRAHEVETLGKATKIDYHSVKVHLGSEGGDAVYEHKFRTTREGDKHVTLRVAKYPDVIYRVLDHQLEFSGGSYEIRAEGIDK